MNAPLPTMDTRQWLHDVARCLAVGHQRDLHLNPQAYLQPTALKKLGQVCYWGCEVTNPEAEADVPALSFLVRLLWSAGLLAQQHDRLEPTPAATRWLQAAFPEQVRRLRGAWWAMTFDATAWPALGWPSYLARRWPCVLLAIYQQLIAAAPLTTTTLLTALQEQGCDTPPGNAANFPHIRQDTAQRVEQLAVFILAVPLRGLGIIELAGHPPHDHIQPTAEGQRWLRAVLAQRAAGPGTPATARELSCPPVELTPPALTQSPVTVTADLHLTAHPTAPPAFTYAALHFADLAALPTTPTGATHYRLTRASLARGAGYGYPVAEVIFWLGYATWGELPPTALQTLRAWEQALCTLSLASRL